MTGISSSWQPSLPKNLQTQLNYLENSSVVGQQVSQAASTLYSSTVNESLPLISEQGKLQSQVSSLTSLQSSLDTLQSAIQKLGSQSTWNAVSASSSNTSSLTISATSGAPQTSVQYTVNQLAQGQISMLGGLTATDPSKSATTSAGTLAITGGLGNATVNITSGDSLDTIASNINNESATTGVQASVVPVSSGGSTNYQLMLSSTQIGATKGAFTVNSSNGYKTSSVQSAKDASITIGPTSSGVTITSATNTFTNALPNTTITAVSTGSGTISIKSNPQSVKNAMESFFKAYNSVEKTVYNGGNASDTTVGQMISSQLPGTISTSASTDKYFTSLSQLGVMLSPGTYSESNGSFTSKTPPSLGWQSSSGVSGSSLPSGVSLQSGSTMFSDAMQSHLSDLQKFLGVTSTGLKLPSGSFLGKMSAQVKLWQQDLSGTTVNGANVTGEINQLQNQIGSSGSTALPGTINYSLNQLQDQYKSQVENLISQWNTAQTSILLANNQYSSLQSMLSATSGSSSQISQILG